MRTTEAMISGAMRSTSVHSRVITSSVGTSRAMASSRRLSSIACTRASLISVSTTTRWLGWWSSSNTGVALISHQTPGSEQWRRYTSVRSGCPASSGASSCWLELVPCELSMISGSNDWPTSWASL